MEKEFLNLWFTASPRVLRIKGDKKSLRRLAALLTGDTRPSPEFEHSPKFGIGPRNYTVEVEEVD